MNFRVRGADLGVRDDRSLRHEFPGAELRGQFQGFLLGEAEEPGQDLLHVLLRQDPRDHHDGREAETPIAKRLDDLGEAVHQSGGHAPVVGGPAGELPPPVQVIEHAGVAERAIELQAVELGEREENIHDGALLVPDECGDAVVEAKRMGKDGVVHATTLSCDFRASGNAPSGPLARSSARMSRPSPGTPRAPPRPRQAARRRILLHRRP